MELSVCVGEVPVRWPSRWTASFQDTVTGSARGCTPSLVDALLGPWQPGGGSFTGSRQSSPLPPELRVPVTALPALGTCQVNGVQLDGECLPPTGLCSLRERKGLNMPHSSRRRSAGKSAHGLCVLFLDQRPARPLKREYCFLKPAHMIFPVALVATLSASGTLHGNHLKAVSVFFSSPEGWRCEDNDSPVYSRQLQATYRHVPTHQVK